LAILAEAGIQAMLLKGVPLALLYYPQPGLRPMADVDLLVRAGEARSALTALRDAAWRVQGELVVRRGYELSVAAPEGEAALDVHWRLVPWLIRDGRIEDPALWRDAVTFSVGGQKALAPALHDL